MADPAARYGNIGEREDEKGKSRLTGVSSGWGQRVTDMEGAARNDITTLVLPFSDVIFAPTEQGYMFNKNLYTRRRRERVSCMNAVDELTNLLGSLYNPSLEPGQRGAHVIVMAFGYITF